jgi:hypothetical protein
LPERACSPPQAPSGSRTPHRLPRTLIAHPPGQGSPRHFRTAGRSSRCQMMTFRSNRKPRGTSRRPRSPIRAECTRRYGTPPLNPCTGRRSRTGPSTGPGWWSGASTRPVGDGRHGAPGHWGASCRTTRCAAGTTGPLDFGESTHGGAVRWAGCAGSDWRCHSAWSRP